MAEHERLGGVPSFTFMVCRDPDVFDRFAKRLTDLGYSVAVSAYDGVSLASYSMSLIGNIPMFSEFSGQTTLVG